jgi:hypothetical protein
MNRRMITPKTYHLKNACSDHIFEQYKFSLFLCTFGCTTVFKCRSPLSCPFHMKSNVFGFLNPATFQICDNILSRSRIIQMEPIEQYAIGRRPYFDQSKRNGMKREIHFASEFLRLYENNNFICITSSHYG